MEDGGALWIPSLDIEDEPVFFVEMLTPLGTRREILASWLGRM
jgi:hypothetical protein